MFLDVYLYDPQTGEFAKYESNSEAPWGEDILARFEVPAIKAWVCVKRHDVRHAQDWAFVNKTNPVLELHSLKNKDWLRLIKLVADHRFFERAYGADERIDLNKFRLNCQRELEAANPVKAQQAANDFLKAHPNPSIYTPDPNKLFAARRRSWRGYDMSEKRRPFAANGTVANKGTV